MQHGTVEVRRGPRTPHSGAHVRGVRAGVVRGAHAKTARSARGTVVRAGHPGAERTVSGENKARRHGLGVRCVPRAAGAVGGGW